MATIYCTLGRSTVVPETMIDGDEDMSLGRALAHKGTPSIVGTVPDPGHVQVEAEKASPLVSVVVGIGAGVLGWYVYKWLK